MDINEGEYFLVQEDKFLKDNRSYQGIVFKAIDVRYPIIIGQIVYNECGKNDRISDLYPVGKNIVIYLNNYDVMTVPQSFVDKLIDNDKIVNLNII